MNSIRTPLCDVLGIEVPIIQAPIGSAACPELTANVCNAGALGTIPITWYSPTEIRNLIAQIRKLTDRPFAVNLCLEWDPTERLKICLEEKVPIISLFWGDASPYIREIKESGARVLTTVASSAEARKAATAGADVIVAQGWEAGGHVAGSVAALPLIPSVVDAVGQIPVVAAGGISDGRGIAAAFMLGAAGVWLGTRFLISEEARSHPLYKQRLLEASETDTFYGDLFDIGWPNAPHRVLRNITVEQWEKSGCPSNGSRPGEGGIIATKASGKTIVRYSDDTPVEGVKGEIEAMALYAGQSVGLINQIQPASKIIEQLMSETQKTLEGGIKLVRKHS